MKLYPVLRADENLKPIDGHLVKPEEAERGEIYICPGCFKQAFLRRSPKGKLHFFAEHKKGCNNKDKPKISVPKETDTKTDIDRLVHRIKEEDIKRPPRTKKIEITIDILDDEESVPKMTRQNRNLRTASEISQFLDNQNPEHIIGAALNNMKKRIPSKNFYADSRNIDRIRKNGYIHGVGLALVKPTHPDRFNIKTPENINCLFLRDVYSLEDDKSSVMLYLLTFENGDVKEKCWSVVKQRADDKVIALMGEMVRLSGYGELILYHVHVTHPDNMKLRPTPADLLERWNRHKSR